ncbi:MAG: 16S rRNA (cytidine(1402)-2'-O)-methyltransferase [Ruminococcaceae bacterium]|nr:16S rRNA (cytidine(1402)-2'-O)-methyltransferase [Oscillospiraceae bacterium]
MNPEKNKVEGGTLYLVATPIGNLADLSERAIKVLSEVDFVAAEDTRNSGLLLSRFGISKPFVSYFEHNKRERGEYIVSRLKAGESCALVTDAGMPAISDPGEDIVRLCAEVGVPVTAVPGCCAAVTALALSALTTGRFAFEGFITTNRHDRRERLTALKYEERTMIFYEAPHKLRQTLDDILEFMGDRRITLCREMTKLNEEIIRTTVSEAVEMYKEKNPRGEYVLVLEGGIKEDRSEEYPSDPEEHVKMYESQGMKRMDAIKAAAKDRGVSKGVLYKELLGE